MAIRNNILGGTDFVNGEVLENYDLNDTNNLIIESFRQTLMQKHGDSVITGCLIEEQSTPDQTVQMSSGKVLVEGIYFAISANSVINLNAADVTNPRYDLISVDSTGIVTVTYGIAASSPEMPSLPTNNVPLAYVYRAASDNIIETANIYDCRRLVDKKYTYNNNTRIQGASSKTHIVPAFRCTKYIKVTVDLSSFIDTDSRCGYHEGTSNTTGRIQVKVGIGSTVTVATLTPAYSYWSSGGTDYSERCSTETVTATVILDAANYDLTKPINIYLNNLTRNLNFWNDNDLYSSNGLFSIEGE